MPVEHPFAERGVVGLEELAEQPFIGREEGSGTLASVRQAAAREGLELPDYRVVMVLGTSQGVVTAAEQGYGLGWVSAQPLATRDASRVATVRVRGVEHRAAALPGLGLAAAAAAGGAGVW